MNKFRQPTSRTRAIVVAIVLPTVVTWVYFHLLAGQPMQKAAYSTGKAIQFALPLVWVLFFLKQKVWETGLAEVPGEPTWSRGQSIGFGVAMGLAVSAAMYGIYRMIPVNVIAELSGELTGRIETLGFASPGFFIGLSVFYALIHSFLEEYYFRWFVFGQLRNVTKFAPAMVVSGLAFMAHHVIVLAMYFGWSPLCAFLSLAIAIGGMIWAWQYEKSRSLVGPWISHMIVDAGIFAIGYDVLNKAGVFAGSH